MPAAMTDLETVIVSRKTPRDGKLEISSPTVETLGGEGARVAVRVDGQPGDATVVSMPCHCKGDTKHVVHVFLESEVFQALIPDSSVIMTLDDSAIPPAVVLTTVSATQ